MINFCCRLKEYQKILLALFLPFIFRAPATAGIIEPVVITESMVKPSDEMAKAWITGKTIILKRRPFFWPDKTENLDPLKIVNFKFVNMQMSANYASDSDAYTVYKLGYACPTGTCSYTVTIKFIWKAHPTSLSIERRPIDVAIIGPD